MATATPDSSIDVCDVDIGGVVADEVARSPSPSRLSSLTVQVQQHATGPATVVSPSVVITSAVFPPDQPALAKAPDDAQLIVPNRRRAALWVVSFRSGMSNRAVRADNIRLSVAGTYQIQNVRTHTYAATFLQVIRFLVIIVLCLFLVWAIWVLSRALSRWQASWLGWCSVNKVLAESSHGCSCSILQLSLNTLRNVVLHDCGVSLVFAIIFSAVFSPSAWRCVLYLVLYWAQYVGCYAVCLGYLGLDAATTYGVQLLFHCIIIVVFAVSWKRECSWRHCLPMLWFLIILSLLPGLLGLAYPSVLAKGWRSIFQTVFPFVLTFLENVMTTCIRNFSPVAQWPLTNQSLLTRLIVVSFDSMRLGSLVASIQLPETKSPVQGPFFNALLVYIAVELDVRNAIHVLLWRRIGKREQFRDVRLDPFRRMMCGNRYDIKYVSICILLFFQLFNWSYSSYILDCSGHVLDLYRFDGLYILAIILVELLTGALCLGVTDLIQVWLPDSHLQITPMLVMPKSKFAVWAGYFAAASLSVAAFAGYSTLYVVH